MATEIKSTSIKSQNIIAEPQVNKPGGPEQGQIIQATGTGDIAKGIYQYSGASWVSLDNAQGDLETLRLIMSTDTDAVGFSSALNSTSTLAGNTNAVPHETAAGTGMLGALEIPSTGGDALLTEFDANKVFRYYSAGANNNNDYFGIPVDIPAQTRGQNIVLKFKYRTEEASAASSNGDFQVSVWDKSNGVSTTQASTLTTGTTIAAGSNILMTAKTNLAVGDRIWFETGTNAVNNVANDFTQAYITSISSTDNNITVSEDVTVVASGIAVTGWLSDKVSGLLPAADSDTDKVGKDFSIAVKTEEDTDQVVVWFSNKSTTTNVIELFFDGILVSQNKFLQISEQVQESAAFYYQNSTYVNYSWYYDETRYDTTGQLVTITNSSTEGFKITANQPCYVFAQFNNLFNSNYDVYQGWTLNGDRTTAMPYASTDTNVINVARHDSSVGHNTTEGREFTCYIKLAKGDYIIPQISSTSNPPEDRWLSNMLIKVESVGNKSVVMESQDEIFTDWVSYTPGNIVSGNFGNCININFKWRRVGCNMEIRGYFTAQSPTAYNAYFGLPDGYQMDAGALNPTTLRESLGTFAFNSTGAGTYYDGSGGLLTANLNDLVNVMLTKQGSTSGVDMAIMAANSVGTGDSVTLRATVPIAGWNSNFNPLLSLPLVEIGANAEYYNYRNIDGPSSGKTYRLIGRSTGTEVVNTISTLGTVVNDTTNGWYFQSNQRVKVTMSAGYSRSTAIGGFGIVKFGPTDTPSTLADNPWGNAQWDNFYVGGGQDNHGAGYQAAVSATFIMEPNEYIQMVADATNFQNSTKAGITMLVEKDFSNTNMAHIIKPAVAILSEQVSGGSTASNAGGTSAAGFNQRRINTAHGDTWFVSGTFDGINGTNVNWTLEPGLYEFDMTSPAYSTDYTSQRLYDVTNSAEVSGSVSNTLYLPSGASDYAISKFTHTVTSSTEFKIETYVTNGRSTDGLGVYNGNTANNAVFSQVKIRKLK
jgi:hypothetical protein